MAVLMDAMGGVQSRESREPVPRSAYGYWIPRFRGDENVDGGR
jgi:hypothetical protein